MLCLLGSHTLLAETFMEQLINHGTDSSANHLFIENPSVYFPQNMEMNIFIHQRASNSTVKTTNFDDIDVQKNNSKEKNIGLGLGLDMGSGLGITVVHQILESVEINTHSDRGTREFIETFKSHYSSLKVAVELTESLSAGFRLGFLNQHNEILGSFRLNPGSFTNFSTSMIGTGGGLNFSRGHFHIGGTYLPSMKGKSEILSEEKIVTSPGKAELAMSLERGNYSFGASMKRWIYKFDDRALGTTLNDDNQTRISLFGLNVSDQSLYHLDQKKIGLNYTLDSQTLLKGSLSKLTVELNQNLEQNLPGENSRARTFFYYFFQSILEYKKGKLIFTLGLNKSLLKEHAFEIGTRKIEFEDSFYDIIGGVYANL